MTIKYNTFSKLRQVLKNDAIRYGGGNKNIHKKTFI